MRRYLGPVLLLLLGTTVGILAAEVLVRIVDPHAHDQALPGGFFAIDRQLGWVQRPNHTVTQRTQYFATTYTTNAKGFRDRDRDPGRTPGRDRVLVFGDSQIFGWGIRDGRRFSDLLEARHPQLEVWNFGVMGYGLDQELLTYERDGAGLSADAVVLFVTPYTVERSTTDYIYRKYKPRFILRGADSLELRLPQARATALTDLLYRAFSPMYLPYFVDRQVGAIKESLKRGPSGSREPAAGSLAGQVTGEQLALTEALLRRAVRVARGRGQRLVLLTLLSGPTLEAIRRLGEWQGFQIVPIEFPGNPDDFRIGPNDAHWNERAQDLIAQQLWQRLQSRMGT
jgi:hypothetical protein